MTKTDQTPTSSPRRTPVGRHRSRTFFDSLLRVHQRACRKGEHRFGKALPIGGGIQRATCSYCGNISIDIRDTPEHRPSHRLFRQSSVRQRG